MTILAVPRVYLKELIGNVVKMLLEIKLIHLNSIALHKKENLALLKRLLNGLVNAVPTINLMTIPVVLRLYLKELIKNAAKMLLEIKLIHLNSIALNKKANLAVLK